MSRTLKLPFNLKRIRIKVCTLCFSINFFLGTSQITGDKSKLSRFFKPFEIFKKTPAKNQQTKNTQPGQEGIDDKKTIEGQMSIFGKKSVLFKLLGGKMEKAIDEEEYDISTKTKNSSKKHKKAKKKAFTTKVREKLVNDLFNAFEAQGKITFSMEEKITAMAATKDSKYLLIASHSVENIVKQEKSLPTHNLESGTTMNDTNVENLRKNSSIPTVPGATEQVKQPCSLWLVNLETNEKEKLPLEGNLKPENEILSLIVTSDGKYVISGWNDGSIQVYDLNKKKKEYTLHGAHQRKYYSFKVRRNSYSI